ncbi:MULTISPECIES: decarboxylase [unclassified Streptomyces]|uniref:decarboxylase n=1 Tax=unclassified Streptomyces TaxID=2593676 RepID=UPI00081E4416|nr:MULTISPECIES: decarboxylase [unclassified Streptomyces]MYR95023.1 type III PLP-dependent enzyme [Streptomyces sp. SID4937]SCD81981.1 diaminopimelate decarboxylase [Streptomyces sp. ScaeMP-e83]
MSRYEELAERFGTPLYVYDLDEIEAAGRDLTGALPEEVTLFYALKANPHPDLVRALRENDRPCRPEISSTGELAAALAAGFQGADCLYTGPGKTPAELREVIGLGVRMFSTDSVTDVRHVGEAALAHGVTADCLLRVNSVAASATSSIRMTGTPSQFGFDSETLAEVLPLLRAVPGVRVSGMHFFPLSNAKDEDSLIGEFEHTIALAAGLSAELGLPLRFLDIGGGFTVPYAVPGDRGSYPRLRAALTAALDTHFPDRHTEGPEIACESGRYLVGASGTLLARVSNVKVSRGRKFVILDAGINTFGGMSGLGRLLPVSVRLDADAPVEPASLVGPLCTPGDILGREIDLPVLESGDLVTIPNAGAYGPTASLLMFLGRPAPTEVVVRGDEVVSVSRIETRRAYDTVTGTRPLTTAGAAP